MAERGRETLRYGPMKPVGLTNPHDPASKPYAVVQLRQDNALGTLCNMVGFQTKLKHGEQVRIFRTIPGLEKRRVRAARRPAPQHLPQLARSCSTPTLRLKAEPRLRFAGQITGCEGYVESAAIGLLAGRFAAAERLGAAARRRRPRPRRSARCSATSPAATSRPIDDGPALLPADERQFRPVPAARADAEGRGRQAPARTEKTLAKKKALTDRARAALSAWLAAAELPVAAE